MIRAAKTFSSIGGIVAIIGGLAIVGIAIYLLIEDDAFLKTPDDSSLVVGIILGLAGLIVIVSIVGMIGVRKQNKCCIGIFQIAVIFYAILFAGLGVIGFVLPAEFYKDTCSTSTVREIKGAY